MKSLTQTTSTQVNTTDDKSDAEWLRLWNAEIERVMNDKESDLQANKYAKFINDNKPKGDNTWEQIFPKSRALAKVLMEYYISDAGKRNWIEYQHLVFSGAEFVTSMPASAYESLKKNRSKQDSYGS